VALEVRMLDVDVCEECGYPEGSFPCRIRHIFLQTGDAKAAND
jgi:hypothetical protein